MTVRASELGSFLFCERAWHYARTGTPYEHPQQLEQGVQWHRHIELRSRRSRTLMRTGALFLIGGIAIAVIAIAFS